MSGHGTAGRDERIGLLGLGGRLGLEDRMGDRLAGGGGLRKIVDVRIGDSGKLGSSSIVGELTDTALRGDNSSHAVRGGKILLFPSNTTRGESIVVNCENWDGDIGTASSKKASKKWSGVSNARLQSSKNERAPGPRTFVSLFMFLTLRLIRRT